MPRVEAIPEFVKALPDVDIPISGARGWLLAGETQQVVFLKFAETVEVPEHSHAEQWEIVVAGDVELRIGGETIRHSAGDSFFIPAGTPHAATVHAGYQALLVFNAPDRYRAKTG
jgi:quercetin dioxygenase-like cupin family protein